MSPVYNKRRNDDFPFAVNMQMIVDHMEDKRLPVSLSKKSKEEILTKIGFWRGQEEPDCQTVYLCRKDQIGELGTPENISFIIAGEEDTDTVGGENSVIYIHQEIDLYLLYEIVQEVFESNFAWMKQLYHILNSEGTLEELCREAYDYFQNPLFVHNPQFYILACPSHDEGMDPWERDEQTGRDMLSAELINSFKYSPVYFDTLQKTEPDIFPRDQAGYRVLYINLWDENGQYQGRICIDELKTPLRSGQMLALKQFARVLQLMLKWRSDWKIFRPMDGFIADMADRKHMENSHVADMLRSVGWEMNDEFICFKMGLEVRDEKLMSITNTCNNIERTVRDCFAIRYENGILILLNLTRNGSDENEYVKDLRYIVREGILKMGISNRFRDFRDLSYAYQQASLALYYGKIRRPTIWIHRYSDYVMDYVFDMTCRELPAEFLCSDKLLKLRRYDEEKGTRLFDTLKVYMENNMNAEQTAKNLFLHRSTLFYRLKRIKEVTGLEWEQPSDRDYLLFSFALLDHNRRFDTLSN